MPITRSQHLYIKTILRLEQTLPKVRSVDLATALGITRASVCNGLARLREAGLVEEKSGSRIVLTPLGRETGQAFMERTAVIGTFLQSIGAEPQLAEDTAYEMENILSEEMLDIFRRNIIL